MPAPMIKRIVLDTCVLVPSSLRDTLVRAAIRNLYRVFWSETIIDELRRTLVGDRAVAAERADYLIERLRTALSDLPAQDFESLIPKMTNNPKDRHVLALAVAVQAESIVTFNMRDFPSQALEPHGIAALHPDAFLCDLLDTHSEVLAAIIIAQARSLKAPRMSAEEVLSTLALHVPTFSTRMLDLLRQSAEPDY